MKIETFADLKTVLQLCRKQGVTEISIDGIQLKLGELPEEKAIRSKEEAEASKQYTDEDLMFWSSSTT